MIGCFRSRAVAIDLSLVLSKLHQISRVGQAGDTKRGQIFHDSMPSKGQTFSGRNPAKFTPAGPEPEPDIDAGYTDFTGYPVGSYVSVRMHIIGSLLSR